MKSYDCLSIWFQLGQHYSDEVTVGLLAEIANAMDRPIEEILYEFGRYWILFTAQSDYAGVLNMAGDDLVPFLQNLDDMHRSIRSTMPESVMPTFAVIQHNGPDIELLYRSEREGLEDFVRGLLDGLLDRFSEQGDVQLHQKSGDIIFKISRRLAA